ncbi:MAG: glycosyltransferase family 39 protein [Terrimicrobiaceae bacterium]|nr:glycosyltransferase family 39 protein [Terrimicrobiaceae bacterium]
MALSISYPSTGNTTWRSRILAAAFALLMLGICTQSNTFPSAYHPDEPSKARQIITGEYNFHHPMLMIAATRLLMTVAGTNEETEAVTVAGRWVSALFTSGAVYFLVLLASIVAGPMAAFAAGALLVTNHELFELAHYFKEDPALLFGLSGFFLALTLFDRVPCLRRAFLLGAALGLAISGKYIGVVAAPFAVWMLWHHRRSPGFLKSSAFALLGLIAVLAAANLPILLHPRPFAAGFTREMEFVLEGHKGITRSVPHGVYGAVFREATNPAIWVLLGMYAVVFFARRREVALSEWMLAAFPLAFAILLSFSPKTHHRYFLPATAILLTLAAFGAAAFPRWRWNGRPILSSTWAGLFSLAFIVAALYVQAPRFTAYCEGFSHEGRAALADYLGTHVPQGTVIVQDKRVNLQALGVPYKLRGKLFAADEGTIDALRAQGVRYVAVAEGDYGRFFLTDHTATADGAADYTRRRAFYERLFSEGELLFDCPAGTLQYLQPHLTLYRLPDH